MERRDESDGERGRAGELLTAKTQRRIAAIEEIRSRIVADSAPRTVESTVRPLAEIDAILDEGLSEAELNECVHPDAAVREAAEAAKRSLSAAASKLALDRELYDSLTALANLETDDEETARFIERSLRDFRRAGVDKDEQTRETIQKVKDELVALSQAFNRNIRQDAGSVTVDSPDALAGLPEDFIAAHSPDDDGKIRITTDYPDFVPVMSYAENAELRRALYFAYFNRAYPKNDAVLSKILELRHTLARLLGHDSYAAYAAEDKMIASADGIAAFVERIASIAEARATADTAVLLARKRRDDPGATVIEDFEKSYYAELVRTESLRFDSQKVRPYFEYGRVKAGVLAVVGELFGLSFVSVGEPAWHPSVETFDVFDGDERIGRIYLDMHPRAFKYKHAAMFPVCSGISGKRLPEAALVCNFPEPSPNRPALLEHSDVVTFFHEFGHLMHHILGGHRAYSRFSGVAVEWDFVEVPSQLFEEWAYSYEALRRFAVHFETGEVLSAETVERLNRARTFGRGVRVRQQMFYAALALRYHQSAPGKNPLIDVVRETQARYSPYRRMEGTHMHASFGHLEGYSALYYTYMWSLVIVRDLFGVFERNGLFDKETAAAYCNCVLKPGGAKDAAELVRDFLGRDYSFDAFSDWVNAE